jgi:DNA-directed RNA polymerase subunit N (RpoN/RPB10)
LSRLDLRHRDGAPRGSSAALMAVRCLARACVRRPRSTINEASGRFSHVEARRETADRRGFGRAICRRFVLGHVDASLLRGD